MDLILCLHSSGGSLPMGRYFWDLICVIMACSLLSMLRPEVAVSHSPLSMDWTWGIKVWQVSSLFLYLMEPKKYENEMKETLCWRKEAFFPPLVVCSIDLVCFKSHWPVPTPHRCHSWQLISATYSRVLSFDDRRHRQKWLHGCDFSSSIKSSFSFSFLISSSIKFKDHLIIFDYQEETIDGCFYIRYGFSFISQN